MLKVLGEDVPRKFCRFPDNEAAYSNVGEGLGEKRLPFGLAHSTILPWPMQPSEVHDSARSLPAGRPHLVPSGPHEMMLSVSGLSTMSYLRASGQPSRPKKVMFPPHARAAMHG